MSRYYGQKGSPGEQRRRSYQTSPGAQNEGPCGHHESGSLHHQHALPSGDVDAAISPFASRALSADQLGTSGLGRVVPSGPDQYQPQPDVPQSGHDYDSIVAVVATQMHQHQHLGLCDLLSEDAFTGRIGEQVDVPQPISDPRWHSSSNCDFETFGPEPPHEFSHRTDPWSPYAMYPEQQRHYHQAGVERLPNVSFLHTVSSMLDEEAPTLAHGSIGSQFTSSDSSYSLTQQDLIDSTMTVRPEHPPTYSMYGVENDYTTASRLAPGWRYTIEPPQDGDASESFVQPLMAKNDPLASPMDKLMPILPSSSSIPMSDATSTTGSVLSAGSRCCRECGTEFTGVYQAGNLARHRRNMHKKGTVVKYPCEQCDKVFKRTDSRLKHYRKDHNGLAADPIPRPKNSKARDQHRKERDIDLSNIGSGFRGERQAQQTWGG